LESGLRVVLRTLPPYVSRISEKIEASSSHNPKGLHSLYRDNLKKVIGGLMDFVNMVTNVFRFEFLTAMTMKTAIF
jgi:hypothetical protein